MTMKLVVNADDLGKSSECNEGIIRSLQEGICSSTTAMVNMPEFTDAVRRVKEEGLQDMVGIHLNISEGLALTDAIRNNRRFCDGDGCFLPKKGRRFYHLSSAERSAVAEELAAQIKACRAAGIEPTHADSHNHMHEEPGMIGVFLTAVTGAGIPFLRLTRNIGRQGSMAAFCYRNIVNKRLASVGLRGTETFGSASDLDYALAQEREYESCEVMVHPCLRDGVLWDLVDERRLIDVAEVWKGIRLSSYADMGSGRKVSTDE